MEFVEFHAEATGLTTASTITLPFDRSITSASDVKGVVLMPQGRATNFGWTTISHGHGPPIDQAKGLALDAEAGVLYVTTFDRVIAVNLEKGDRVVAAVLR